jgi:hypothetical protein
LLNKAIYFDPVSRKLFFQIEQIFLHEKKFFWKNHVQLAKYFTGPASILFQQDTDESLHRYVIFVNDLVVVTFCVRQSLIFDFSCSTTNNRIDSNLLQFLIPNWIELVKKHSDNKRKEFQVFVPRCCTPQFEALDFESSPYPRDHMVLILTNWKSPASKPSLWTVRPTIPTDAASVTKIYIDAYQGTIDEQFFLLMD